MSPPSERRGVMSMKTLGRGFWIALIVSLVAHALLIGTGRFQMQRWEEAASLEAQIEPEEFEAVALPEPEAVKKPAPVPQQKQQTAQAPTQSPPDIPAPPSAPTAAEPTPTPPAAEVAPVLPPSPAEPQPASDRPYAALTRAAEKIRDLPARIEIVYELNGMLSGRQTHVWQRSGQQYSLETEGQVTGLIGLFMSGKMIQKSRGQISSLGLMPEYYEMQRFSGKKEALRFDYNANVVESIRTDSKHGTRTLELPLLTGAQDPLSSIYQLAMAAQGDKNGFIVAANTKRVKGYPYRTLGTETLNTKLGEMQTLHVSRTGDSDKGAVHLWLATARHALPVKVTYVDEDGTEWVMEAVSIKAQ